MKKNKKLLIIFVSIIVLVIVNSFFVINKVNEGILHITKDKKTIVDKNVSELRKILENDYQTFQEQYEGKKIKITDRIKEISKGNINLVDDMEILNNKSYSLRDYSFEGYNIKLNSGIWVFVSLNDKNINYVKKLKKHKKITVSGYLTIYDCDMEFLISSIKTNECVIKTTGYGDAYKCNLSDDLKIK